MANEQNKAGSEQTAQSPSVAPVIQLDPSLIAGIVTATIQALKAEGMIGGAAPGATAPFTLEQLSTSVAEAVTNGISATTRRKVTFGEYVQRGHSVRHPKPLAETPKFKPNRTYWENGALMRHEQLFDEEIVLLNQITHSGRYVDRLVEISVREGAGDTEEVFITFANTREKQMEMSDHLLGAGKCKTKMEAILKLVIQDQAEERALREETNPKTVQRRKYEGKDFASAAAGGRKPWEQQ